MSIEDNSGGRIRIGDLSIDPSQRVLWRDKEKIRLPKLSYELLMSLVRHAPGIVSTDQLLTEVWGEVVVGEETVKQRISLLRQALGDGPGEFRYIESIRGVGYRLVTPVIVDVRKTINSQASRYAILAIAAALIAVISLWSIIDDRFSAPLFETDSELSIAVLPFEDLSPTANRSYFSDGVHEEVITQLAKIDSLAVTSRTSVMPYRRSPMNAKQIAEELDVRLLIEGSVRYAEDRVRITVQLIDAIEDQHLWVENYDRPLSVRDLFAIQSDVALKVASALRTELKNEEVVSIASLPTKNLVAYNNYLLGRHHLRRSNAEDLRRSIEFFEAAVATDPLFAEAYAGLGRALTFVGTSYGWMAPNEAFPLASQMIEQSLQLQPDSGNAMSVRGDILSWYDWRWDEAESAYRLAQATQAGELGYMLLLSILERHDEATQLAERMIARHPRDPWVRSNAAWRFLSARDPGRAIEEASIAIEIDSSFGDAFASRGWSNLALGNIAAAISDFERNVVLNNRSPAALAALAVAQAKSGESQQAQQLLDEIMLIAAEQFVPPEEVARVYVALGNNDEAIAWLESGLAARSRGMIFLQVNDSFKAIADDPRFRAILHEVDLPTT